MNEMQHAPSVLIVDDEPVICDLFTKLLNSNNIQDVSVNHPTNALALIQQEHFDILIIDMVMPGMNGYVLYEKIKQIHPEVKAIFMSGHSESMVQQIFGVVPNYLQKPFSIQELLERIWFLTEIPTDQQRNRSSIQSYYPST